MKSSLEKLTSAERAALAHWYDSESYKALNKLIEQEKTEYAEQHVGQKDIEQIRYLTGMVGSLNKLVNTIEENFKEVNKPKKS